MKLSVILITYNRCQILSQTLRLLLSSETPQGIEWLIIDNNSSDKTKESVEKYQNRDSVRYFFEPHQGINWARNKGVQEARGEYLLFIDDDIDVEPNWLISYLAAIETQPYRVFGGRSILRMNQFHKPHWLALSGPYACSAVFSGCDYGNQDKELELSEHMMPVGRNMLFKRDVFDEFGLFRTDIGLKGGNLMPGAEYEFFLRLSHKLKNWFYVSGALTYHTLYPEQLKKSYFRRRMFGIGRVQFKLRDKNIKNRKIGNIPFYIFSLIIENKLKFLKNLILFRKVEAFYFKMEVFKNLGFIYEALFPRKD